MSQKTAVATGLASSEPKPPAEGAGTRPRSAKAPPQDPYDSFTWEVPDATSPEDPWGLQQPDPPQRAAQPRGGNPYDTGVFNASWTGRFDER